MRKLTIVLIFICLSCDNTIRELEVVRMERFSTETDTTYKDNSTEIESITRTFYHRESLYKEMKIEQILGEKMYKAQITSYSKSKYDKSLTVEDIKIGSVEFKNDKEFEWFMNTIDTMLVHSDKKLNYWIKEKSDIVGSISNDRGNAIVYFDGAIGTGFITFGPRELDSLRASYFEI